MNMLPASFFLALKNVKKMGTSCINHMYLNFRTFSNNSKNCKGYVEAPKLNKIA